MRDRFLQLRSFGPEEQEPLRAAWRRLRELPPEERERLIERLLSEPGY